MGSDEIYEGFKYQILWNPMGSDEIQWNSMMILLTQVISKRLWFRVGVAYY